MQAQFLPTQRSNAGRGPADSRLNRAEPCVTGRTGRCQFCCGITGIVIHHQHMPVPTRGLAREHAGQTGADIACFVVGRNHHREGGLGQGLLHGILQLRRQRKHPPEPDLQDQQADAGRHRGGQQPEHRNDHQWIQWLSAGTPSNFVDSGYRGNAPLHRLPDVLQHTNNVVIEIGGAHDGETPPEHS